ncbi:MAG: nitroreductase family protein [Deltaproteobacteria bacterium]|nr:nitroreductase family protein [Deltaproteobacteria bacterium]
MKPAVLSMLMKRRSIRKFSGKTLSKAQVRTLLEAAMCAPSANNKQPWRFIVVTDPELIREVCLAHPHAKFGVDAGAVFVVFGGREGNNHLFSDLGAATQNLLLCAANIGLGATWCGMNEERQKLVNPLVGLPDRYWCYAVIPVGVPAEKKPPRTQYDETKVFYDRFKERPGPGARP